MSAREAETGKVRESVKSLFDSRGAGEDSRAASGREHRISVPAESDLHVSHTETGIVV